jgi:deazaflavin-dependent oxidoreductase (nitroreductase family)
MNRTWVAACAVAEAVGMTAAAGAARSATALADHGATHAAAWGLAIVVLGGLVEGTALGLFQARALARVLGPKGRRRWLTVTVLVAGLGWAAASAPAVLAADDGGAQPPLLLVLLGAAGLGAAMGAVLGAAQAWALRHRVSHPWRWATGSTAGWTVAMPVIFVGATSVGASWPWWLVVPVGTGTGLVAGAVLGVVSGPFLETLEGPAWRHRVVLGILSSRLAHTPAAVADGGLVALGITGDRSGRVYRFPVEAAWWHPGRLVVLPGHPERKTWWRNIDTRPDVEVLLAGDWAPARARLLRQEDAGWAAAREAHAARFPSAHARGDPLVVLELTWPQRRAAAGGTPVGVDKSPGRDGPRRTV